ncbi:MAG TPA: RDD family protein [Bacteroidales bacterium]|nr:RDD family protein [Bacteroidales bacterium]
MKYKKRQEWFVNNEMTLASVYRRFFALSIDIVIIMIIIILAILIMRLLDIEITKVEIKAFQHSEVDAANVSEQGIKIIKVIMAFIPSLYFVLMTYFTNGQSIGKKISGIRIVSIYHQRIGFWHCIERTLGYAASTLEFGLGFLQVFWNVNRMTLHDRIAETIVVNTRSVKKTLQNKKNKQPDWLLPQ